MTEGVWTIGKILNWTQQYFSEKGIPSPRLDAEVLLAHVLQKERIYLYVHFDEPLNVDELNSFRGMVKGRLSRRPVAYLTGQKEFMGLTFKVNEHTLVPRPETEILVQSVLDRLDVPTKTTILGADIGTGTGAIALSLLKYRGDLRLKAVDISAGALQTAKDNAVSLSLSDRIEFLLGDLTQPLMGEQFTFIVSNPPYIPQSDLDGLEPEVRAEPQLALAGGVDGLDFYRRLAESAPSLLNPHGFLAVEVGINQADDVAALFCANELIRRTEIIDDLAHIARVVVARRE